MTSRSFGGSKPPPGRFYRGNDTTAVGMRDIRSDVDEAFASLEAEVDSLGGGSLTVAAGYGGDAAGVGTSSTTEVIGKYDTSTKVSYLAAADSLVAGTVIRVTCDLDADCAAGNLTVRLRLSQTDGTGFPSDPSTGLLMSEVSTSPIGTPGVMLSFAAELIILDVSGTNYAVSTGMGVKRVTVFGPTTTNSAFLVSTNTSGPAEIDLTADNYVFPSIQFSSSNSGNAAYIRSFNVQVFNAA